MSRKTPHRNTGMNLFFSCQELQQRGFCAADGSPAGREQPKSGLLEPALGPDSTYHQATGAEGAHAEPQNGKLFKK